MTDQKEQKEIVIKLNEGQFLHLMNSLGNINSGLDKLLDKLESKLVAIENEIRLLRIEIMDKQGKFDTKK